VRRIWMGRFNKSSKCMRKKERNSLSFKRIKQII
jgi:hypothetical protein